MDWMTHVGWLSALALVAAFLGLRKALKNPDLRNDLRAGALFLLGYLVAHLAGLALAYFKVERGARYVHAASYILFAWGCIRPVVSAAFFAVKGRQAAAQPKIVRDVIDGGLYLVAVMAVARATLKVDLGSLLTTSAILSVVIGLALQETLGNLFAGLALQLERPFQVGDWIRVGDHTGQVVQVGWRGTRILTQRKESVIIPNAAIGKEAVVNFTRSGQGVAKELLFDVSYDAPPNEVKDACLDVLTNHPRVRTSPPPQLLTMKFGDSGIQYRLRVYVDAFRDADPVADELHTLLWYRLRRDGIGIPYPTRTVFLQQMEDQGEARRREQAEVLTLLMGIDFLRPLGPDGLERLAQLSRKHLFGRGEQVIRQGEAGDTFYVIVSGEVSVRRPAQDHTPAAEVARLGRGEFFGEMSLLTGEPRSATVVATVDSTLLCVDRASFGEILRAHDGLATSLSDALAARREGLRSAAANGPAQVDTSAESKRIFAKLRDIFSLA